MSARFSLPASRLVATRLGPVAVAESGSGRPVLAIHGGLGGCDQSWILARALLADAGSFRILAVARPGYPGTPLAGGATPQQQADLYEALLDALGLETVLVTALSAGGSSALEFAVRHPGRCDGLILVSAASMALRIPPRMLLRLRLMTALARIPGLLAWLRRKALADPAAARAIANPQLGAAQDHPEAGPLLRLFLESLFTGFTGRLPGTRNDIAVLSHLTPLPPAPIAAPVLILHGAEDFVVPPAHARAVAAALPQARLTMLDGGHEILFTHMDAVRAAVTEHLADVRTL